MSKTLKPKKRGVGLEIRTFEGKKSGNTYTVLKTTGGSFHVLVETEAKDAAEDCGATTGNTRARWERLWREAARE